MLDMRKGKMMNRSCIILGLAFVALTQHLSAPAHAYDASWYKTDFWAGEYPHGFTLKQDVTTQIRAAPDPKAPGTIKCTMKKGATYHPWNGKRVKSSKLEFITYVPTEIYVIKTPAKVYLRDEKTEKELEYSFKKGDEWTYLTYYAEGMFKMSFKGKSYAAEQDLMEISKEKGGKTSDKDRFDHEWMKLTCANGAKGWLLLSDTAGNPAFDGAKISEYGKASDVGGIK
jgi:hypothetical protein